MLDQSLLVNVGDRGAGKDLAGVMAQEDARRTVGHVARLAELLIIMGKVHWLVQGIMVIVLISVVIAIGMGRGHVVIMAGAGVVRH